ncbi:MAG: hypothetical protein KC425_14925, partial [Anaerolineales bacterium]|nr:hypothetical protein [Anaerolineales bacterium]
EVQALIVQEIESQYPPEIIFLNQLMEAETREEQQQLLDANRHMVQPQLVQVLEAMEKQIAEMGQDALLGRLREVKAMVQARLR